MLTDEFGDNVAIHGDTVVAGAPEDNSPTSAVNVFVHSGTVFLY